MAAVDAPGPGTGAAVVTEGIEQGLAGLPLAAFIFSHDGQAQSPTEKTLKDGIT